MIDRFFFIQSHELESKSQIFRLKQKLQRHPSQAKDTKTLWWKDKNNKKLPLIAIIYASLTVINKGRLGGGLGQFLLIYSRFLSQ
jgi:hypothetical protein